ncbi:MAG: hypothetical protein KGZ58_13340 [Ignavibacteriales bacterium]|nr:hypothetical protein [Ignavibacteriales bacterium]
MKFLDAENSETMSPLTRRFETILHRFAILFVACTFIFSFFPRDWNWGLNALAFFPLPIKLLWLVGACSVLISPIRERVFEKVKQFVRWFTRKVKFGRTVVLLLSLDAICWLFPVQFYHLGDGQYILDDFHNSFQTMKKESPIDLSTRTLAEKLNADQDIHAVRAPLSQAVNWFLILGENVYQSGEAKWVFRIIGLIALAFTLFFISSFFRKLQPSSLLGTTDMTLEKLLFGILLIVCSSSVFFFGYVENYTLFFVAMLGYLLFGWLALEGKIHFVVPALLFSLLLSLQLGSLIMAPTFLVLLYFAFLQRRFEVVLIGIISLVFLLFIFMILDFSVIAFLQRMKSDSGGKHFLAPFHIPSKLFSYPLFSFAHLVDILNLYALTIPLSLVVVVSFIVLFRNHIRWKEGVFLFLSCAAFCGLLFTLMMNFELGTVRDWDVASVLLLPVSLLAVYFLMEIFSRREIILFSLAGITLLHSGIWIALNANDDKSMKRFLTFDSSLLMGHRVRQNYYWELSTYYRDKNDSYNEAHYLEKFLFMLPSELSVWGKLVGVYGKLGDKEKQLYALQQAVALDTTRSTNWYSLGLCYSDAGKYNEADSAFQRSIEAEPSNTSALYELGKLQCLVFNNNEKSVDYLTEALAYEPNNLKALKGLLPPLIALNRLQEAEAVAQHYLSLVPNDSSVLSFFQEIEK